MHYGTLILVDRITRTTVKSKPDILFIFGDNMKRIGFGGQAKEMRGEPNVVGIPTKWAPSTHKDAFLSDDDWKNREVVSAIVNALIIIEKHLMDGKNVIMSKHGIGTGKAKLEQKAPFIFNFITKSLNHLIETYGE